MYLIFIDESGKPSVKEKDPFVVATLIIHDEIFFDLENDIDDIVANVLRFSTSYLARAVELHGKSLFQNKEPFNRYPIQKRVELADKIFDYIFHELQGSATTILVGIKKKEILKLPEKHARKIIIEKAYMYTMERIAWFLRDYFPTLAQIIIDTSELDSDIRQVVINEINRGMYTSRIIPPITFLEGPIFVKSEKYRALQLTDLIAYVFHRLLSGRPTAMNGLFDFRIYFTKIKPIIRKGPNNQIAGYGVKIEEI